MRELHRPVSVEYDNGNRSVIVSTGETRDGNPVWMCDGCKTRFATHFPPEKIRCFCRPPTLPELWDEFREARKRFKAAGSPILSKEDQANRLSICESCPDKLLTVPLGITWLSRCKGCGCFVTLKSKWATENCPRGHWPGDPPFVESNCGGCPQEDKQ